MIPVEQTIIDSKNGNCLAACVASILEIGIDDVPNPHGAGWFERWQEFLVDYGYQMVSIDVSNGIVPAEYHIISGKSLSGDWYHCVVGHQGKIIFDPNPNTNGLETEEYWDIFVPIVRKNSD